MRNFIPRFAGSVLVAAVIGGIIWVSAGDLDPPPGPVAPTMKTLTEVEPRTAIHPADLPMTISQPGSYYLTGNFTASSASYAIDISSTNVTLDLNGFMLNGNNVGTNAISIDADATSVVIRDGSIRNWTGMGINGEEAYGVSVDNIHVDMVGSEGFFLAGGSVVDCSAKVCGAGFEIGNGTLTRCVARYNTHTGFNAGQCTINECLAANNTVRGFSIGLGATARNCSARYSGIGFQLNSRAAIVGCNADQNDTAGIRVISSNNRVEDNHVISNGIGLDIDAAGNYVAGNTVRDNTDNYEIAPGNQLNILLCELPESIYWTATVTLAGSLTGSDGLTGVFVTSDNVTIDLAGHALVGVTGSVDGIGALVPIKNLAVRNGTLRDWDGGGLTANNATNGRYQKLIASGNGGNGISVGDNCLVTDCVVESNGGDGISVGAGSSITNCITSDNTDDAIVATLDSRITGCTARDNGGDGITVTARCHVTNNTVNNSGTGDGDGADIHALGDDNRIEGNHCIGGDRGLDIDGTGNYVVNNTVKGAADNYDIAAGNQLNILLCEIPESIDWPAKVTLAGSLTGVTGQDGIDVTASDVSIDLGGHALVGVAGSVYGIHLDTEIRNVSVTNGVIRDWGDIGLYAFYYYAQLYNGLLANLRLYNNGGGGIHVGGTFRVTDCQAMDNGGHGIRVGTSSVITDCVTRDNTDDGFSLGQGCIINTCASVSNDDDGIHLTDQYCAITNCTSIDNLGYGIEGSRVLVRGNYIYSNNGDLGVTNSTVIENFTPP